MEFDVVIGVNITVFKGYMPKYSPMRALLLARILYCVEYVFGVFAPNRAVPKWDFML